MAAGWTDTLRYSSGNDKLKPSWRGVDDVRTGWRPHPAPKGVELVVNAHFAREFERTHDILTFDEVDTMGGFWRPLVLISYLPPARRVGSIDGSYRIDCE